MAREDICEVPSHVQTREAMEIQEPYIHPGSPGQSLHVNNVPCRCQKSSDLANVSRDHPRY